MGINACLWRDILSPCALSSKLKHVLGLGHTQCRIQHIFSATEFLHRISPIKSLTGDWCLKAKTSSHLWSKWIREQHRERHLTLLTLTPVHCVVVWGSALPPHYLLSCRKTGDRLLYLSTSHLTDGGAGTLSPRGLQRAGYAGARIRIIRIITSSKNNPEARFYITHHRWEIKMGTSKHSEIISNFLPPTW